MVPVAGGLRQFAVATKVDKSWRYDGGGGVKVAMSNMKWKLGRGVDDGVFGLQHGRGVVERWKARQAGRWQTATQNPAKPQLRSTIETLKSHMQTQLDHKVPLQRHTILQGRLHLWRDRRYLPTIVEPQKPGVSHCDNPARHPDLQNARALDRLFA